MVDMWFLLASLIVCLLAGAFFASRAIWLTTQRGNTISDVLNSGRLADVQSIRLEILDKIKLSSNLPIVGLYVVAAIVGLVFPGFALYETFKDVNMIELSGSIRGPGPALPMDMCAMDEDIWKISTDGFFKLPLKYSGGFQMVTFEHSGYRPKTLKIRLNKVTQSLFVKVADMPGDEKEVRLNPDRTTASLPPDMVVVLDPDSESASEGAKTVPNQPSKEPTVSPQFQQVPPPQEVQP